MKLINEAKRLQELAGISINEDPIGQRVAGNPEEENEFKSNLITKNISNLNNFIGEQEENIKLSIEKLVNEAGYDGETIRNMIDDILLNIENPNMFSDKEI